MTSINIVNLIFEAAVVKRLERTGWQMMGDNRETVGEHTFMTSVIAYFLAKQSTQKVSLEKVLIMSLFHDFHEGRIGDADKISLEYVKRDTGKANSDIFSPVDKDTLILVEEYEKKQGLEARLVYEANIIALLVELKVLEERGNVHAREWIDANSSRLRIKESINLAKKISETDSHDWWKDIRDRLRQEFRN